MTQEELGKYLHGKWCNYSAGLAMSFSFREDKNLTIKDVQDAFECGFYEFQQILYRNNIRMDKLKLEE